MTYIRKLFLAMFMAFSFVLVSVAPAQAETEPTITFTIVNARGDIMSQITMLASEALTTQLSGFFPSVADAIQSMLAGGESTQSVSISATVSVVVSGSGLGGGGGNTASPN
ncbi:MAG: hypothetical protein GYB21_20855 [Oceanospirillales bacterium]|nr:hypothetical protein [Oceanospirillales bacterium]